MIHEWQIFGGGEPGIERLGAVAVDTVVGWPVTCEAVVCEVGGGEIPGGEIPGGESADRDAAEVGIPEAVGETADGSCAGSMS